MGYMRIVTVTVTDTRAGGAGHGCLEPKELAGRLVLAQRGR